jgi:hypothetical protein
MVAQGFQHLKMVVGAGALQRRDTRPLASGDEDIAARAVRKPWATAHLYVDGNCTSTTRAPSGRARLRRSSSRSSRSR